MTASAPDFDPQLGYLKASFRPVTSPSSAHHSFYNTVKRVLLRSVGTVRLCAGQFEDEGGMGGLTFWEHCLDVYILAEEGSYI